MLNFLKKKWYIVLYFIFLGCIIFFMYLAEKSGEDYKFSRKEQIPFEQEWNYVFSDGRSGVTELPADLGSGDANELTLTNTLPAIKDGTIFVYRSRHTAVQIYLDGELIYDQLVVGDADVSDTPFLLPGNVWNDVELDAEDSGKEVQIVTRGVVANYLYGPGSVYLGDRGTFYLELLKSKIGTMIGAVLLAILGFILLVLWAILAWATKGKYNELICLSIFLISMSLWEFTETRCLQFVIHNMRVVSVFAFEMLMLLPVPIALYFTYGKNKRTAFLAKIGAIVPLVVFVLNNLLHFLHIRDLGETLGITQIMLGFEIVFIGLVQIRDIISDSKDNGKESGGIFWKLPAGGLAIMMPLLLGEVIKYFFGKNYSDDAIMATIGATAYILSLAAHSALKLASDNLVANEANRAKSQFLANMSHEIRTPLNAILGFDEMILRESNEPAITEYAESIRTAGGSLRNIINTVLDLSKIESGKMEINNAEYNTEQLLDRIIDIISPQAEQKKLKLILHIDENIPERLYGDEVHIQQILVNLLNNAVKYTKEGSVTFTVKREKDIPESKECELLFSVKDTGIGIREEDRERLFEKFERLDFANNSNVEGTGLGMSIVVRLLESMGSNIELISTYGAGSDFYFRLRQKVINHNNMGAYGEGRREQAKDSGEVVHYIAPDAYVLIVDDVILNLKVACSLLARLKLRMDTAESGMEAIELVQKNRYDVILMDHMMPKMDGIEATKKIRGLAEKTGDSYYREVPILALTANAMSGMREKFMEEGLQDFISKPVEGRELETTLLKWLPKDKVCRVQMQQTQENEAVEESNSTEETEWNLQIPGINMEEAKKYSPDYEMYLDTLETYLQAAPITSQRIDTYRKEENLSDYTITVHGLKSASKIIGAMELSETARQLEEHGHKGEAQAAWQGTDHLLEMLKDCAEEISKVLEPKEAGKALWGEELKEKLDELKTCAENFDMGGLMEWERENTGNTVQPEMEEQWNALLGAVREVAFSEILEQIETLMNIL